MLYVLLHCCSDVRTAALLFCCIMVCSKGLVGGWVGGGCTASSVVGGWAVLYVGLFFLLFPVS